MSDIRYRPELPSDPTCKACKQGWPIHAEADGSNRQHFDLFATPEYGVVQQCPTQNWPDKGSGAMTSPITERQGEQGAR